MMERTSDTRALVIKWRGILGIKKNRGGKVPALV